MSPKSFDEWQLGVKLLWAHCECAKAYYFFLLYHLWQFWFSICLRNISLPNQFCLFFSPNRTPDDDDKQHMMIYKHICDKTLQAD